MFENIVQLVTDSLQVWLHVLTTIFEVRQAAVLAIVLVVAWVLQFPLRRLLDAAKERLAQITWSRKLLIVLRYILLPLTARLLGQLAVDLFQGFGQESTLLSLANGLITLWFAYSLIMALLRVNMSLTQARFWSRQVVLPLMVLAGLLHVLGLLSTVLDWGFAFGQQDVQVTLGSLLLGVITIVLFVAISRGASQFLRQIFLPQAGAEPALAQAISALVYYGILITGLAVALSTMGISLTTFAVIAGGLSVGLGFGLQEIVKNFMSGFILLFDRSLGPGDVVYIDDNMGRVQKVGIRSTTVKTKDNIELIVPNSYFLTEIVTNLTRSERLVRLRISVGVTYNASPRDVEQALLEAATKHSGILSEPAPSVQFRDFGDSSLNFDLLVWTDEAYQIPTLTSDLRYNIWDALAARQIEMPFPQRDLHIRSGIPWSELMQSVQNSDGVTALDKK